MASSFFAGNETCLAIDKAGNKWIGFTNSTPNSPAALAKYNIVGGFWTYYCTSNTPAIPNNRVNTIACDTSGNVWIGTIAGLVKYDGVTFTAFTTTNGLPSNNILSLECSGTMLYIGTHNGLSRYNGSVFFNYNTGNGLLDNDTVTAIKAETPVKIWLGGNRRLTEVNFNSTYTFSNYNSNILPYNSGKTNSIFIDNTGKKWLGTQLKGIVEYVGASFIPASITYSNIIGAFIPVNCSDIVKGPNNGPLFYTNCGAYITPSGNSYACLLELLPGCEYKTYYVPNNNYAIGGFMKASPSGEIFVHTTNIIANGGMIKFMYSFNPSQYESLGAGPGCGVNTKNFKFLDINRVKAGIANRGDMFWDLGQTQNASYEVPKGSNTHSDFGKALWIGALDESNQLHIAAQTYRQNGNDFWPGPLDTVNVSCDSSTFKQYDKIWKISYNDINDFILNFQNGNIANNTYTPTADIITWPAKGTGNNSRNLAPFVDINNNGIYDPLTGGDYPRIKGDQALYFIFNDKFAGHTQSWGAPLGIEVHAMAYAYGCPNFINGKNELAYTTFYHYQLFNRSSNNYHSAKISLYDDIDLGGYYDDYIGCYPTGNLGFSYNSDGFDQSQYGVNGYQNYPPSCGSSILKGPVAKMNDGLDNDNDGITDEVGEECLMNEFIYYNNNFGLSPAATQFPSNANQYFNYMNAQWKDSTHFTCGGTGYGGSVNTNFVYPWTYYSGMPCNLWSDGANPAGDRRFVMTSGPFELKAHQSVEYEFAEVWAVDSSTTGNNIGAVNKLISDAQKINAFYQSGIQSSCLPNMTIGIKDYSSSVEFSVHPNPTSNFITIQSNTEDTYSVKITNVLGQSVLSTIMKTSNKMMIDLSGLASGVYFISLTKGNSQTVKKIIKE